MTPVSGSTPCATCGGTGKLAHTSVHRDDAGNEYARTMSSSLCPCRRDLPARDGKATWWTTEIVHREDWTSATQCVTGTFEVDVEVPISADNYRVHRTGENVYYPAMARITFDREDLPMLLERDLEDLAACIERCRAKVAELDSQEATA